MSLEKSPDRGATAWNSLLAHRRNDLVQGQIRLFGYQSQQPFHVLLQRRRAPGQDRAYQGLKTVTGVRTLPPNKADWESWWSEVERSDYQPCEAAS